MVKRCDICSDVFDEDVNGGIEHKRYTIENYGEIVVCENCSMEKDLTISPKYSFFVVMENNFRLSPLSMVDVNKNGMKRKWIKMKKGDISGKLQEIGFDRFKQLCDDESDIESSDDEDDSPEEKKISMLHVCYDNITIIDDIEYLNVDNEDMLTEFKMIPSKSLIKKLSIGLNRSENDHMNSITKIKKKRLMLRLLK